MMEASSRRNKELCQNRVILVGPDGKTHELKPGSLVLGRSANCDIIVDHPQVSRRHALLEFDGQVCVIYDEGSITGTFIKKQDQDATESEYRVGDSGHPLKPGDRLRIGEVSFVLSTEPIESDPSPQVQVSSGHKSTQAGSKAEAPKTVRSTETPPIRASQPKSKVQSPSKKQPVVSHPVSAPTPVDNKKFVGDWLGWTVVTIIGWFIGWILAWGKAPFVTLETPQEAITFGFILAIPLGFFQAIVLRRKINLFSWWFSTVLFGTAGAFAAAAWGPSLTDILFEGSPDMVVYVTAGIIGLAIGLGQSIALRRIRGSSGALWILVNGLGVSAGLYLVLSKYGGISVLFEGGIPLEKAGLWSAVLIGLTTGLLMARFLHVNRASRISHSSKRYNRTACFSEPSLLTKQLALFFVIALAGLWYFFDNNSENISLYASISDQANEIYQSAIVVEPEKRVTPTPSVVELPDSEPDDDPITKRSEPLPPPPPPQLSRTEVEEIERIHEQVATGELDRDEAEARIEDLAIDAGKDGLEWAVENMPVYDDGEWKSFGDHADEMVKDSEIDPDAPFAKDPVGTTVDLMFDENSPDEMMEKLGLDFD